MKRAIVLLFLAVALAVLAALLRPDVEHAQGDAFQEARARMVKEQLRARDITDTRVLSAMARVPRHAFVPRSLADAAYRDGPLPIGEGQTISQPYVVALMTQHLGLKGKEKVLEIGTGSGYQAAVLAELVPQVYTVEIVPVLARRAAATLKQLGYHSVQVREGDGYKGWPEAAPFDAIIVTAAPDHVPRPLVEQLADGGRIVLPVGPQGEIQVLRIVQKHDGRITTRDSALVQFVPLTRARPPSP